MDIIIAIAILGGLGLVFGLVLAAASKVFYVETDPRLDQLNEALPGANCGGCGFAGCAGYAEAVLKGECNACVLPIENSFAGEVGQTVDLIHKGELYVSGIYRHEIRHNLLGVKGAKLGDIKKVFSHPQALMQCADFIKENNLTTEESNNTALSAKVEKSAEMSVKRLAV